MPLWQSPRLKPFPSGLYWYGGLLNYLIPSGGGQFAVEAPYIIPAAKQLGIGMGTTVITFAWSDMMTDMIQPFWAIAMLAVAKLHFRDIMGWLLMVFFVYFIITSSSVPLLHPQLVTKRACSSIRGRPLVSLSSPRLHYFQ